MLKEHTNFKCAVSALLPKLDFFFAFLKCSYPILSTHLLFLMCLLLMYAYVIEHEHKAWMYSDHMCYLWRHFSMKNILIKDKSLMLEANHWNIVLVQQKS